MLAPVLLFVVGLLALIKGGDWFVDGATGIARRFRLPDIIVGATVVSVGTTLPEVMVGATGALNGQGAMAYGNALGSVICNTALIAAISATANPGPVNTKTMKLPTTFFFGAAAIYCVAAYFIGAFTRPLGLVLLAVFVAYMVITVRQGMREPEVAPEEDCPESGKIGSHILLLILGAALVAVGADLLVDNGTILAQKMGVPETVIALTFVALGTSLPELVTTIISLRKGHAALGIGNVIGANVFNLVLVSGAAVTLSPFEVPAQKLLLGQNATLVLDIPMMLLVMSVLTVPVLVRKKLSRWQGIVLLCLYSAFCVLQFVV